MVISTISLLLRTMPVFAGIYFGAAVGHAAAVAPVLRQQCDLAERQLDNCGISGQKTKNALRELIAERAAMSSRETKQLRKSGASVFEGVAPFCAEQPPWRTYRRREDREPVMDIKELTSLPVCSGVGEHAWCGASVLCVR